MRWSVENGNVLEENVTVTAFGFMAFTAMEDTMNAEVLVTGTDEPIVSRVRTCAREIPPVDNPMVIEQFNTAAEPPAYHSISPSICCLTGRASPE